MSEETIGLVNGGGRMTDDGGGQPSRGAITLDQLIALNDEIVALTRSGMPLERGLVQTGAELRGRLGGITAALGKRMEAGESLPEALKSAGDVPPVYRAVVEAGLRSGHLPTALEGLATYAKGYAEAREQIGLALCYPMIVVSLAFGLFVFIVTSVIPRFLEVFGSLGLSVHGALRVLGRLGESAWYWGPVFPVLLLASAVLWFRSRSALSFQSGRSFGLLRMFPWVGSMMAGFEASSFADLLALLLEFNVPYPEALRLAGDASGDPVLARGSHEISEAVERGLPPDEAMRSRREFPPLLRWVLATGPAHGDLVVALRQLAKRYRSRARFQGEKLRVLLPTVLLFVLGVSATLGYALVVFFPLTSLYEQLSGPIR